MRVCTCAYVCIYICVCVCISYIYIYIIGMCVPQVLHFPLEKYLKHLKQPQDDTPKSQPKSSGIFDISLKYRLSSTNVCSGTNCSTIPGRVYETWDDNLGYSHLSIDGFFPIEIPFDYDMSHHFLFHGSSIIHVRLPTYINGYSRILKWRYCTISAPYLMWIFPRIGLKQRPLILGHCNPSYPPRDW